MDDTTLEMNIIYSVDKNQFINYEKKNNEAIYGCKLFYINLDIIINEDGSQMTCKEGNFVAKIEVENTELDFKKPFEVVKDIFLSMVKIVDVAKDDLLDERNKLCGDFENMLKDRFDHVAKRAEHAEDLFQLMKITKIHSKCDELLEKMIENEFISQRIKKYAETLSSAEISFMRRNDRFPKYKTRTDMHLHEKLKNICKDSAAGHRNKLLKMCIDHLKIIKPLITKLDDISALCINNNDMDFFSKLGHIETFSFDKFWNKSEKDIANKIARMSRCGSLHSAANLTDREYYELTVIYHTYFLSRDKGFFTTIARSIGLCRSGIDTRNDKLIRLIDHFRPGIYPDANKIGHTLHCFSADEISKNFDQIPDRKLVWIYMLDVVMGEKKLSKMQFELYRPIFDKCIRYIVSSDEKSIDTLSAITMCVLLYVNSTFWLTEVDLDILKNQIGFFANVDFDIIPCKKLINYYIALWQYWFGIGNMIKYLFHNPHDVVFIAIRDKFKNILYLGFNNKIEFRSIINFNMACVNFIGLHGLILNFHLTDDSINSDHVTLVNQNGSQTRFQKEYFIKLIVELFNLIDEVRSKEWPNMHSDTVRINSITDIMLSFIRSFEYFMKNNYALVLLPYKNIIKNCTSYEDYKSRIDVLREAFYYTEEHNASEKHAEINSHYEKFDDKYQLYMKNTLRMEYDDKIKFIMDEINTVHINKDMIPYIVAGLSAMWSINISRDLVSLEKCIKPLTCVIVNLFHMLRMDEDGYGIEGPLTELNCVVPHNGDLLLLALFSSVMIHFGYNVQIIFEDDDFMNEYEYDFNSYCNTLKIERKLLYKQKSDDDDDEKNDCMSAYSKYKSGDVTEIQLQEKLSQTEFGTMISIIDEVDVFQMPGNVGFVYTFNARVKLNFPALDIVQEKIWELINEPDHNTSTFKVKIYAFLEGKSNDEIDAFFDLLNRDDAYDILKCGDDYAHLPTVHNNRSLYESELDRMIRCADRVANAIGDEWFFGRFRLDDDDLVSYATSSVGHGVSDKFLRHYYNVFNYFRLKKAGFDHKNCTNYGYLNIDCAKIPLANLPKNY